MGQSLLDDIAVQDIPLAGRGIRALRPISKDTIVLRSEKPAAHVIFREYRKEVCAQCFLYDRGRTLSIRHNVSGKVFCTSDCLKDWLDEYDEIGLSAWERLHNFIQLRSKAIKKHSVPLLEEKPNVEQIELAWSNADATSQLQKRSAVPKIAGKNKHTLRDRSVDPDILGYLLSGILFYHRQPGKWQDEVLRLAMDDRPYRDSLDLGAHCDSFVQLATILPEQLVLNFTPMLCQGLINATSHNSFGIRSGSEEGEEYMGYALYPDASYFNHSCSPNISKKRIGACWEFKAEYDIQDGEQCCITYLGGDEKDLTVEARRARLRLYWGFDCMCERCLQESGS